MTVPKANVLAALNLTIRNDIREIANVMECFDAFAAQHGISSEVRAVIDIAFDEMLSNIIYYAYPDAGTHAIEIQVDFDGERVIVAIADEGVAFNPVAQAAPNTDRPLADLDPGGWGIHLVRTMLDDVTYRRHLDRNIITLVKRVRA